MVRKSGCLSPLNRELTRRDAFEWMRRYALVPDPEGALRYLTIYRTQIASYAIGEAAARRALDPSLEPSEQWASYEELLMLKAGTLPQ